MGSDMCIRDRRLPLSARSSVIATAAMVAAIVTVEIVAAGTAEATNVAVSRRVGNTTVTGDRAMSTTKATAGMIQAR